MRLVVRLLAALTLGLGFAALAASPAHAAADRIDSFAIAYDMAPDGVLHVQETITWRFGDDSGRHGIQRYLVQREPYGTSADDVVYDISNLQVTSPDRVSTQYTSSIVQEDGGRTEFRYLRIGDPDRTISAPTATYVIDYDVAGAMRTRPDYDEFYWDGPGFDNPAVRELTMRVTVPGGAQDTSCFVGPPGRNQTTPCQRKDFRRGGAATFAQDNLPAGQSVSIGVRITPGLVVDNQPHLEPDASKLSSEEKTGLAALGVAGAVSLVGAPLLGIRWWRRHGRDQRYAGLAPGTVPLSGQTAHVVPNDPDIAIPVAFSPPHIPVAEAGLLVDGQVDARETAGTIIDLAVRGALRVESQGEDDFRVTLLDPDRATAPHEMVLLTSLFAGQPAGATVDLSTQGSLTDAHEAMQTSVINQVTARGWFRKVPNGTATGSVSFGAVVVVAFIAFQLGAAVLLVLVPLIPVLITVLVIRAKLRRGQRTPDGRAVCDQVEGFRTYLATAEADQLRFEEGEDIFSRYLPWAIVLELADRWAELCGQLVAMGRLPDTVPYWYVGSYHMTFFNTAFLTSSLANATTPPPSTSGSSGTGFGGGSSFGGGGFSGGGGGGGGSSSW